MLVRKMQYEWHILAKMLSTGLVAITLGTKLGNMLGNLLTDWVTNGLTSLLTQMFISRLGYITWWVTCYWLGMHG